METLRVNFVDFWPNFKPDDNYFYHLLTTRYVVVIDESSPDLLFHSVDYQGRKEHLRYDNGKTIKIFYTGECVRPDFTKSHFALTFDHSNDPRCYRLPLWALMFNWFIVEHDDDRDISYLHEVSDFLRPKNPDLLLTLKNKSCAFIASSPRGRRMDFIPKLLKVMSVDCAGKLYNNVPQVPGRGDQINKIEFLQDYKMNVCFENESYPGYTTEKIVHSMFANCLPIYWGSSSVDQDFNVDSFINANGMTDEQLIDVMMKYDAHCDLYVHTMSQPWFKDNQVPSHVMPKNVLAFIERALG